MRQQAASMRIPHSKEVHRTNRSSRYFCFVDADHRVNKVNFRPILVGRESPAVAHESAVSGEEGKRWVRQDRGKRLMLLESQQLRRYLFSLYKVVNTASVPNRWAPGEGLKWIITRRPRRSKLLAFQSISAVLFTLQRNECANAHIGGAPD